MGKKKKADKLIMQDEMTNVIPPDSIEVLVSGEDNPSFKVLSKRITTQAVKLTLEHRSTKEKVKLIVPIEYLELHKIPYKHHEFPTDKLLLATLNNRPTRYKVEAILDDLNLKGEEIVYVIVYDKESGKTLGLDIYLQKLPINETENYAKSCFHAVDIKDRLPKDIIWRNSICQTTVPLLIEQTIKKNSLK